MDYKTRHSSKSAHHAAEIAVCVCACVCKKFLAMHSVIYHGDVTGVGGYNLFNYAAEKTWTVN